MLKQTIGTVNCYSGVYNNKAGSLTEKSTYWRVPRGDDLETTSSSATDKMPKLFSVAFRLLFLFVGANSDRQAVSEWAFVCLYQC